MYFSMSRLSFLDVKWADVFDANDPTFPSDHQNPHYELLVVADGTVHLQLNEEPLTLQSGDVVLMTPWERHRGWKPNERQGRFFWAQFACEPGLRPLGSELAPHLPFVHAPRGESQAMERSEEEQLILPRRYRTAQQYKLLGMFEQLVDAMERPRGYYRYQASIYLAQIVWMISSEALENSQRDTLFPISYLTFRRLLNHLDNFYDAELDRQELEKATGRKYEYLGQLFKKYAGISILQYVQERRVQRSEHLLLHTKKTVREIAETVGYSDPFYFSRLFKKMTGLSPQAYRERQALP